MIKNVIVKNYRVLKDFEFSPKDGINIIVGDNNAGKSTLLEAIMIALSGKRNGQWVQDALNPYWFNKDSVQDFFKKRQAGEKAEPPEISIEVEFDNPNSEYSKSKGVNNQKGKDACGVSLRIYPEPSLKAKLEEYVKREELKSIPTEYYTVDWKQFSGLPVVRSSDQLSFSYINSQRNPRYTNADYYTQHVIKDLVDTEMTRGLIQKNRTMRMKIQEGVIGEINSELDASLSDRLEKKVELQIDQSSESGWSRLLVLGVDGVPLEFDGQGDQVLIKMELALQHKQGAKIILLEEPENHFSHTTLLTFLNKLESNNDGKQIFVTTHSAFVQNRLGLDRLWLLHHGRTSRIGELDEETVKFFKKISGIDTLRFVLARKSVIVEGPSDEMVFNWAYQNKYECSPAKDGIDVITFGISGKRILELAKSMNKKCAVLRDNDGKQPDYWISQAGDLVDDKERKMFIGEDVNFPTLEPQIIQANKEQLSAFAVAVGYPHSVKGENINECELREWMAHNKTEWALHLVSNDNNRFKAPSYMYDAMEFARKEVTYV